MPIICLEGASSVGKSSTAMALADRVDAYVVAETAFLFERPNLVSGSEDELKWFLDCNMKRWQIAIEQSKVHELVVLDGDHIKLWYDWVYGIKPELFGFCVDFYRSHIQDGSMEFPDAYFVLYINEADLRQRKESDPTRKRRGFEKHLKLIEPQKRLFTAINQVIPGYAKMIEAKTVEENVTSIIQSKKPILKVERHSVELFDFMVAWMKQNAPN